MSGRILVIEDDPDIALAISTVLRRDGFEVTGAGDGRSGLRVFHEQRPCLVLLDIGLPVLDGWQVLERIRDLSDTPVLMLTAHGYDADQARGMESGADDYLAKPFGNAELLGRVRVLLGQSADAAPAPGPARPPAAAGTADGFVRIDHASHKVFVAGNAVTLSPTEFRLLAALVAHSGQVLSPSQLLDLAWNDPERIGPDRVKFSIMRLRRKLGAGHQDGSPIEAVRGFGYRYVPPPG